MNEKLRIAKIIMAEKERLYQEKEKAFIETLSDEQRELYLRIK